MERFVYKPNYARMLVSLIDKKTEIDKLAKSINANTGQLRIVLQQLTKEGVLELSKPGREYEVALTEKGKLIAKKLAELMHIVRHYVPKKQGGNPNESSATGSSTV